MAQSVANQLRDALTIRQVNLFQYDADVRRRVRRLLEKAERDLEAQLEKFDPTSIANQTLRQKRVNALLAQTRGMLAQRYREIAAEATGEHVRLGRLENDALRARIKGVVGVDLFTVSVSNHTLRSIASDIVIQGAPTKEWWERHGQGTQRRFADAVRLGMYQGKSIGEIRARVRGTKARNYKDGILEVSRRDADALVRSSTMAIANAAREAVILENMEVVRGVQAIITFDGRTTEICIARQAAAWNPETGDPLPDSPRQEPYPGPPPWHWNCRSTLIPVLKAWSDITGRRGANVARIPSTKASMDGQIAEDMSYSQWLRLKEQDAPGFADGILGVGKAQLWRAGQLTLSDLIDETGRPRSLADLRDAA